jgi:hypothetical protein
VPTFVVIFVITCCLLVSQWTVPLAATTSEWSVSLVRRDTIRTEKDRLNASCVRQTKPPQCQGQSAWTTVKVTNVLFCVFTFILIKHSVTEEMILWRTTTSVFLMARSLSKIVQVRYHRAVSICCHTCVQPHGIYCTNIIHTYIYIGVYSHVLNHTASWTSAWNDRVWPRLVNEASFKYWIVRLWVRYTNNYATAPRCIVTCGWLSQTIIGESRTIYNTCLGHTRAAEAATTRDYWLDNCIQFTIEEDTLYCFSHAVFKDVQSSTTVDLNNLMFLAVNTQRYNTRKATPTVSNDRSLSLWLY